MTVQSSILDGAAVTPPYPALLRLRQVQRLTGLSRSTIYRLERAGAFPSRVRLSARASAWPADEVGAWVRT
ncbi:MAG: helix-turn-helix transcriptional regulator, partial [Steroidobacteraceae bacterium]